MKKLLTLFVFLCSVCAFAQDVIVKKDGSTIVCRVVELSSSEIVYKKWTELNGSNYVMNRSDVSAINYQDGKKVDLLQANSLYTPGNQNNGVRQYNDLALLKMDYANNNGANRNARKLRNTGWIGGAVLLGAGVGFYMLDGGDTSTPYFIASIICVGGAVIWTSGYMLAAHKVSNQAKRIQAFSIYQQEFKFKNGTLLSPSIDMLQDQAFHNKTVGVGVHYNF